MFVKFSGVSDYKLWDTPLGQNFSQPTSKVTGLPLTQPQSQCALKLHIKIIRGTSGNTYTGLIPPFPGKYDSEKFYT